MKTFSLFELIEEIKEPCSFSDIGNLSERQIQIRSKYIIENYFEDTINPIRLKHPEIYEKMLKPFERVMDDIKIREDIFSTEKIFEEIRKINPKIDLYSAALYSTIYLIKKEKEGKVLIFKDKQLKLKNILMINNKQNAVLLYKMILKDSDLYIQKTQMTPFLRKLSQTIFPERNEKATIKNLISAIYGFVLELPSYTKQTKDLSKNAKKILTILSPDSNPYRMLSQAMPNAFGLNIKEITDEKYADFEKQIVSTFKELKYKIKDLEEMLKENFFKSFGEISLDRIKKRLERVKDLDSKVLALSKSPERKNWVELTAIILVDKSIKDFTDEDVILYQKNLRLFISKLEELERSYIERLETEKTFPVYISIKTPKESFSVIKHIEKQKNSNTYNNLNINDLTENQKISIIIELCKKLKN